ncbi:LysR family transcriptional regulator [Bacillus dakarensis]|uniref:LysR family transcriptional regulator n=1 Tax=Robertmurraya dakarensis TaxID=1926278 RepID=UPI000981A1D5|nr:LysR family transcriptional regulator [Bacillus dakarensis]
MRIDQLIYLVEVSKYKSISLAAENLHITQPTISQALNALEAELDVKLFHRSRIGTIPTDDGKIIIKKAIEILEKVNEISEFSGDHSKLLSGTLSIASVPSFSMHILSSSIASFTNTYQGVTLNVFEDISSVIKEEVRAERVNLGFIARENQRQFDEHDLYFEKLIEGHVMACVGRKSPLASKSTISYKEIAKNPIVSFKSKSPFFKKIMSILSKYREPSILFNSGITNEGTGKQILSEGVGVGFVSSIAIKNDPYFMTNKLIAIPISEKPIEIAYGYVSLKSRQLTPAAKEYLRLLRKNLIAKKDLENNYITIFENEEIG